MKRRFGADVAASARLAGPTGAVTLIASGPGGDAFAAVFAESPSGLGAAVDGACREGASHLYFFAEANSPDVARRAAQFSLDVSVVSPEGDFQTVEPDPPRAPLPMPAELGRFETRFRAAGLDPVWEHGVLTGEWLGLEVARAAIDPDGRGVEFDVGVGKHDREGNRLLYPDGPSDELLAHAVATVAALRRSGVPPHPANQLVPDRWLRSIVVEHPRLVGLDALTPAPPPEPRSDLRQRGVAPAWGFGPDGTAVLVVCSAGVDPDLVAQAADARVHARLWPGAPVSDWRLVVVVPEGDDHPLTRRTAALLRDPATVLTVPAGWRSTGA